VSKWYEEDPNRLELEKRMLAERGFIQDEAALLQHGRIEFLGTIHDSASDVVVRIVCPPGFPFQIPWFFVPELPLNEETRHIGLSNRQICLRFIEREHWKDIEHIADLLEDAAKVLIGQHTKVFGEEHTLPDQDLFGTRTARQVVLFPDDLREMPEEAVVNCRCIQSGDITAVLSVNSKMSSEPVVRKMGGTNLQIKVFKLTGVPVEALPSFADFFQRPKKDWREILDRYAVIERASTKAYSNALDRDTVFGVVFEFQGNTVWQFFKLHRTKGVLEVEVPRTSFTSQLNARISSSFDTSELTDARVLVVGAGAIGSTVAVELACAGVGELVIFDNDVLTLGNVIRHEALITDVGKPKVEIVSNRILVKNPRTKVHG
jgi:hypothetical protein